jgi:putative hydrolase of the HAD superfamily
MCNSFAYIKRNYDKMNVNPKITLKNSMSISDAFKGIENWVFDLDNTLYPSDSDLWPRIDQQITLYVMELLGVDGASARALQKYYYERYGTTLWGLMNEHDVEPHDFLTFAHDIDRSHLAPNADLSTAIGNLIGRKFILTNGSTAHAKATAEQLGILQHFDDIYDIVSGNFVPKPEAATYKRFFDTFKIDPKKSVMFEDLEKNLKPAHEFGMVTVLIVPKLGSNDHREAWEHVIGQPAHVDFVTDDLTEFLKKVL